MRIVLEHVWLEFGVRSVLRDVSLTIGPGTSLALMGPSGSGKSSLLALLAGLLAPTSGARRLEEAGVGESTAGIAWVMQTTPLLVRRSALDNVRLAARCQGFDAHTAADRSRAAMSTLGIAHLARLPVAKLSGGERQRVSIGRAMATEAPLLLADEPTAALDATNADQVASCLVAAVSEKSAVVIATHDLDVAKKCDVVMRLADGVLSRV